MSRSRLGITALALIVGVVLAARSRWLCDDIFITFRYASNIVAGHGVVYNVGERVEGFTHFLWLAMIAVWRWAGGAPETIVIAVGLVSFAGVILACGLRPTAYPLAAIALALHPDIHIWATSGLETMAFTLAVVLAMFAQIDRRYRRAGIALSVAVLLRPDALVFCAVALVWAGFDKGRARAFILLPFAVCAAYVVWRLTYYGDLFPNPYYSKSASVSYWDQGWYYVSSYFKSYWSSLAFVLALPFIKRREVAIPLSFALAYVVLFVARVGGDFMFARFMIPIVPLLYVMAENVPKGIPAILVTIATLALLLFDNVRHDAGRSPDGRRHMELESRGIMDEYWYYTRDLGGMNWIERDRVVGEALANYLQTEHVTVLLRGQAALAYYAKFSVAIENSGLTDRAIARMPLSGRGRPGHEKSATLEYMKQRRVDLVFQRRPYDSSSRQIGFRMGQQWIPAEVITENGLVEHLIQRFPNDIAILK